MQQWHMKHNNQKIMSSLQIGDDKRNYSVWYHHKRQKGRYVGKE